MLDLKKLFEKILGCVYESGTDGVWTWKKYSDGTFDMWRNFTGTPSSGTHYIQLGTGYYGYYVAGFTYPNDCKPVTTGNIQVYSMWTIGNGFAIPGGTVWAPTLTGFSLYAVATSPNVTSVSVDVYVHGHWK